MLRALVSILTVFAILPATLAGPSASVTVASRTNPQCDCDWYYPVPLYRAFNAGAVDHFYTTNLAEITNAVAAGGWAREGTAGRVLSANATGALPLYRLYNPSSGVSDHLYTTLPAERASVLQSPGWTDEGIAGYVLAQPACGTVPLFRLFQAAGFDHFYTADAGEMANAVAQLGYTFEVVIGYIWPNA